MSDRFLHSFILSDRRPPVILSSLVLFLWMEPLASTPFLSMPQIVRSTEFISWKNKIPEWTRAREVSRDCTIRLPSFNLNASSFEGKRNKEKNRASDWNQHTRLHRYYSKKSIEVAISSALYLRRCSDLYLQWKDLWTFLIKLWTPHLAMG